MPGRRDEQNDKPQATQTREGESKGKMTVEEAGEKGGQRVRELVEEGKDKEAEESNE
jgi:hypothetical protein